MTDVCVLRAIEVHTNFLSFGKVSRCDNKGHITVEYQHDVVCTLTEARSKCVIQVKSESVTIEDMVVASNDVMTNARLEHVLSFDDLSKYYHLVHLVHASSSLSIIIHHYHYTSLPLLLENSSASQPTTK